jgi:hypothetical protein
MIKQENGELVVRKKGDDGLMVKPEEMQGPKEAILITSANEVVATDEKKDEDDFEIPDTNDDETPEDVSDDVVDVSKSDEKPVEQIVITSASAKQVPVDHIEAINKAVEGVGLSDILSKDEEKIVDGYIEKAKIPPSTTRNETVIVTKKEESSDAPINPDTALEAVSLLEKFKNYITGAKFDKQCESAAKKHGVNKSVVKNKVVRGFLGTIANTLDLGITIAGDVIMSAINFVAFIINKVLEFTVENLRKLVTVLTLNCGATM